MTNNYINGYWVASAGFFCLLMWTLIILGVPYVPLALALPQFYSTYKAFSTPSRKAIAPVQVDGRTHDEWYELIKVMSKEEYERLSRPALDGLEGSTEGYGGWDAESLVGRNNFIKLREQWYPEKHCKYCGAFTDGIPGNCMWDGPCHQFQAHAALEQRRKAREITSKYRADEKQSLVLKSTPKAYITTNSLDKEVRSLQAELIKWDREYERHEREMDRGRERYNKYRY